MSFADSENQEIRAALSHAKRTNKTMAAAHKGRLPTPDVDDQNSRTCEMSWRSDRASDFCGVCRLRTSPPISFV